MLHRILIDDRLKAVFFDAGRTRTLLECLDQEGVEMDSHCRAGFCGACRVKLVRGQVRYPSGQPLACIRENEILPCCCEPVSDIEILRA